MKHTTTQRLFVGALSATLALSGTPAVALAEAARSLTPQATGNWTQRTDGTWRFRALDGTPATGWAKIGDQWFFFGADGVMRTGWQQDGGAWYWLGTSGRMRMGEWAKDGGAWYWLGWDGAMATGWHPEGDTWYYLGWDGAMRTGWQEVDGAWYYFNADGSMVSNDEVDGYWLGEDGAWDEDARPAPEYASAQLTVTHTVDSLATEALVRVESDIPFAQDLGSETLSLDAAWEGATIAEVTRTSTTEAEILLTDLSYPDPDGNDEFFYGVGSIVFAEGSFADANATGVAAVNVVREGATILDSEYAYFDDGTFVLSVDAGSAQLLADVTEEAFTLPANPDIRAVDASYLRYDNTAAIAFEVPGDTPYEQFRALDEALTAGGLSLNSTTIGPVIAYEAEANRESALSYVAPELTAYVERGAGGKGYQVDSDGSVAIHLVVRVVSTGGDPDLSKSTFIYADEDLAQSIVGDVTPIDSPYQRELFFEPIAADELAALKEELGIEDTDELMDALAYQLANRLAQGVSIGGGITNRWGIELPEDLFVEATMYNLAGLGETGAADETTLETESASDARALAVAKNDTKATSEALKYMSEVTKIIGSFVQAYTKSGLPGGVGAVGSVIGLLSTIVGTAAPTSWTINDVMEQVIKLDGKMDTVTAQLGDITYQLDKLEASVDYKSQVGTLTKLAQQGMAYRPWVTRMVRATAEAPDRETYQLGDPIEGSATGKALADFYAQTTQQSQLTAAGKTTFQVASELADAIVGNSATQQTGGARSFFNYTATCVNWEPEAFYARQTFLVYVSDAFTNAYIAASNELNQKIAAATNEVEKSVYQQNLNALVAKAEAVSTLLDENGTLMASTRDRTDGKVLCTVDGKLYKKATSENDYYAVRHPLLDTYSSEFSNVFGDLLSSRDEDKEHDYHHKNSMSRAGFETMAKRESYVRTVPGYENVGSILDEFEAVGIVNRHANKKYDFGKKWSRCSIGLYFGGWFEWALVGDPTRTSKSDSASNYHKRTYSADMYDIEHNRSLGSTKIYDYNVDYDGTKARWYVWLSITPTFEMVPA